MAPDHVTAATAALQPVPGFEGTAYAWAQGRLVWAGTRAVTDHPRNWHLPWQAPAQQLNAQRLRRGAAQLLKSLRSGRGPVAPRGWLLWSCGQDLPFPMQAAQVRLQALRTALWAQDLEAFETAALRLLGLGHGLTPSGDDFLGALLFTLRHAPVRVWQAQMPGLHTRLAAAAAQATNPISAALLQDLMAGSGYRALHELLDALNQDPAKPVAAAVHTLLAVGASSGADMLAGVLLALQRPDLTLCTTSTS
jgi:Protein of unknown function (DUF2877)